MLGASSEAADESVGSAVLASPASGATTLRPSLALDSLPPQAAVATAAPTAPAARRAARESRPASVRVGPSSALAVAPQNGQNPSPFFTCREHPGHGQNWMLMTHERDYAKTSAT
jgi:hypothetical protein